MGFERKQRPVRRQSFVESLECRRMFSVVNVTPGNFLGAIAGSNPGDTISFAQGEYDLAPGSVPRLPGDRTYLGNGATLKSDGSAFIDLGYGSNLTFSGFNLDGVAAKADHADNLNFNNNTVSNANDEGFLTTGMTNSKVDNNTFKNMSTGVYGYPSDNNQVDGNDFDYVVEPIHFSTSNSGTDISGNVISHATRIGIELQVSMDNMTVNNNYFSDWLQQGTGGMDWHMAISCTTGGSGNAPYTDQGQNITISGNTFIQNGPAQNVMVWAKSAIEIMGYSNITISNNYSWNWGNLILNGCYCTLNSNNNVNIGGDISAPDSTPWPIAGVNSSNDRVYGLNDSNQPGQPSAPSAGSGTQAPAPTPPPAPAPAPTPAPTPAPAPAPAPAPTPAPAPAPAPDPVATQTSTSPQQSTDPTNTTPASSSTTTSNTATSGSQASAASGSSSASAAASTPTAVVGPLPAAASATSRIPSTIAVLAKPAKPVKPTKPAKVAKTGKTSATPAATHTPHVKPARTITPAKNSKAKASLMSAAARAAASALGK